MKKINFFCVKLFILLLINLLVFAVSFILLQLLNSMENQRAALLINSFASCFLFWLYTLNTSRKMKNNEHLSGIQFAARETSIYFVLILIITIVSLINNNITKPIFIFFMPNTFFYYLTDNSFLGALLQTLWYGIIIFLSRMTPNTNKKHTDK